MVNFEKEDSEDDDTPLVIIIKGISKNRRIEEFAQKTKSLITKLHTSNKE